MRSYVILFFGFILCFNRAIAMDFETQITQRDSFNGTKTNAIKIFPTSVFFDHFALSYERYWKERITVELSLGIIKSGIFRFGYLESQRVNQNGFGERQNTLGIILKLGAKYMMNNSKFNIAQPLKGFFIKPEFVFVGFDKTNFLRYQWVTPAEGDPFRREIRSDLYSRSGAFLINVGNQYVFSKSFSFEWNFGLGVSSHFQSYSNSEFIVGNESNFLEGLPEHLYAFIAPTHKPFTGCYTLNFKIGYLF